MWFILFKYMKRLYRSDTNVVWKGVLGGIGEYFDIDPVLVRLIFLALLLITAVVPMVLFYILAIFIVPRRGISDATVIHDVHG